jgi:hypothetical protein
VPQVDGLFEHILVTLEKRAITQDKLERAVADLLPLKGLAQVTREAVARLQQLEETVQTLSSMSEIRFEGNRYSK